MKNVVITDSNAGKRAYDIGKSGGKLHDSALNATACTDKDPSSAIKSRHQMQFEPQTIQKSPDGDVPTSFVEFYNRKLS